MARQNLLRDVFCRALRPARGGHALWAFLLAAGLFVGGGSTESFAQASVSEDPSSQESSQERALHRRVQRSLHGTGATGKDGPMASVGPKLIRLYHAYQQHKSQGAGGTFTSAQPMVPVIRGDYVVVDAIARGDPRALRDSLQALGLRQAAQKGRVVSGLLPIGAIKEMAGLAPLNSAAPPMLTSKPPQGQVPPRFQGGEAAGEPRRKIGATTTQGDVSLHADQARERFEADGAEAKVCALSTSYDNSEEASTTAAQDVQSGDLPGAGTPNGFAEPVEVLQESPEPSNDEGRAMLQIVHDIAPGAELGFFSPFGTAGFAVGIGQLASAGCDVITDDLTSYAQPMFQDGLVSQAVDAVSRNQDVLYVNAAGNEGEASYASSFSGSGRSASSAGIASEGTLHDFNPGSGTDVRQQIEVPAEARLVMGLQWDDPFFRVSGEPGADTDLDLYLLDGEEVVASSTRDNVGGDPFEILAHQNESSQARRLDLAISLEEGPPPDRLKHVIEQGGIITEYRTESPTVFAHNDAATTLSVGASAWFNTPRVPEGSPAGGNDPPLLNGFSSKGGTPLLFDEEGNRLSEPVRRKKPDVTAPDGGNTTFFGFDLSDQIDRDDFPNFFGTSAASPHAAGVAALMIGLRPDLSPEEIEQLLEESATDIRARVASGSAIPIPQGAEYDRFSGTGLIRAHRAVQSALPVRIIDLAAEGQAPGSAPTAPSVLQWRTEFERSSEGFVIERRLGPLTDQALQDNSEWKQVGFVPSKASGGRSTDTLQYRFEGQVPTPGQYAFRLRHVTEQGPEGGRRIGAAAQVDIPIEGEVAIGAPRPNPSRGRATAEVVVEEPQQVRAILYDALGRRVRTLYNDRLDAGTPLLLQVGDGGQLASGTYFLRVRGEEFARTRRMTVVR